MNQPFPDRSENGTPDDTLARAIASLRGEAVPPGPSRQLIAATLDALYKRACTTRSTVWKVPCRLSPGPE